LGGPLTPVMIIAGGQVIIAICNYTFDSTPDETKPASVELSESRKKEEEEEEQPLMGGKANERLSV
jgi:UDP-sugar transporter A1/2/3